MAARSGAHNVLTYRLTMISLIDNLRIRSKILFIAFSFLAFVGLITGLALYTMKADLLGEREIKVRHLVEAAYSLVARYDAEAKAGRMTEEEAKAGAIAELKAFRYGNNDYVWINDMAPVMVMHPIKPELDGKDLTNFAGPDGAHIFTDRVKVVRTGGGRAVPLLLAQARLPGAGAQNLLRQIVRPMGMGNWHGHLS